MTVPKVDEIMRLVENLIAYEFEKSARLQTSQCYPAAVNRRHEAEAALESAIAELVDERDAAVLRANELDGHYQELDHMLDAVKAERDALALQVAEFRADLNTLCNHIEPSVEQGVFNNRWCAFCKVALPRVPHAFNCTTSYVTRIKTRLSAEKDGR
jgi:hypothetical protein